LLTAALAAGLLLTRAELARALPIDPGTSELRVHVGALAAMSAQPPQFTVGLDYAKTWNGATSWVFGYWAGVADDYTGMELLAGVKHRFLRIHPDAAPFLLVGGGVTAGFHHHGEQVLLGIGARFGAGVDFFATERIVPGVQVVFDVGPRFTPSVAALGSVQITFGVSFFL
jgi:hypothetical protein